MKNLRIIPKLDIKNQNLVKGISLEGLRVLGDPKNFVTKYYLDGADEIIYHDVVASLYNRDQILKLIERTATNTFVPITVGGGIKSVKHISDFLNAGADRIFVNSSFIRNKNFIREAVNYFGSSTILASLEVLKKGDNYFCYIDFGREETEINLIDWLKEVQNNGVGEIIITSIENDGKGNGFDLNLADLIHKYAKIPYIINGGFSEMHHFDELFNVCDPNGIVLGSMLHYGFLNSPTSNEVGNQTFINKKTKFMNFGNYNINDIKNYLSKKKNIRLINK